MRRAQDGDRPAYESLLAEVAALLRAFARARLRRADWLEDVVQETLLSIHRDRHTYDPARPFLPWMYAIARHRLADFVEKQRRRREIEDAAGRRSEELVAPHPFAERGMASGLLRRALAALSLRQLEVIRMLKVEGLTVAEISRKTGLSHSTVKVTAHRGYKTLRKLILGTTHGD